MGLVFNLNMLSSTTKMCLSILCTAQLSLAKLDAFASLLGTKSARRVSAASVVKFGFWWKGERFSLKMQENLWKCLDLVKLDFGTFF